MSIKTLKTSRARCPQRAVVHGMAALVATTICIATASLPSFAATPLGSIGDVRVAPMLTTHWEQGSAGSAYCYNYYTPQHHVCGCTATAVAQIMYYHRYPTERITPGERVYDSIDGYGSWYVDPDGTGGVTRSSDSSFTAWDPAYGGPYDWSSMVNSPTSATSENSRKAIGRLTRDAGLAMFAHYNVDSSGATSGYAMAKASGFILNLHYADAVRTGFNAKTLVANLDAGLPVQVGLASHDVVADGYGYNDGKLYIHLNYGYGGTSDGWYDPTTDINGKGIQDMVANIFPPSRGARHSSVISGRVLDASGSPVANATVTATGATNVTATSSANGMYAFILPVGTYTFSATSGGVSGTITNCAVEASSQKTRAEGDGWATGTNNSKSGVNVTLGKTAGMDEPDDFIDYVESDGSQYIDTGVCPNANMTVDADVELMGNGIFMGVSHYESYPIECKDGYIAGRLLKSAYATSTVVTNTGRHRVVATGTGTGQKFTIKVGDETAANSTSDISVASASATMFVFKGQYDTSVGTCPAKLYGLKIYINGALVRDYVPGIKDGVAGLYDRVDGTWKTSESSSPLIAGPVATPTSPTPAEFSISPYPVTLTCATQGATIRYTTDGSDPSTSSTVYSAPFEVTGTATVKARAYKAGLSDSPIFSQTFTYTPPAALAHRWSFTTDLSDSIVPSTPGTMHGSGATFADGAVKLPGGSKGTCYVDLGANKLPTDSVTIETWFTLRNPVNWTRVFVLGSTVVFNSRRDQSGNPFNFDSLGGTQTANKSLAKDTPYYAVVTFTPDGNGGVVEKQYVKKVGDMEYLWQNTVTKANWSVTVNGSQNYFWLGHSGMNQDPDTKIDIDEVRVWNGTLGGDQLRANAEMGPDACTVGLAKGFCLAAGSVFRVPAEGYTATGTVTLGAGSKLLFDTASFRGDSISFTAPGYSVPSGDILDYVELTDSVSFDTSVSGGTITVSRNEFGETFHTGLFGRFAKRAQDFDVGDYVQTGLIAHYDGIRNAGADLPHAPSTRTWKNLVSGGVDAAFEGDGGTWNAAGNGFIFDGSTVAHMNSPGVNISKDNSTIQIACDIDWNVQSNGTGWYPGIFTMTGYDFGIYINNTGAKSNVLIYKSWPLSNENGRPTINPWNGKYVTAAIDASKHYLVQGTSLGAGVGRSPYWTETQRYAWGGKSTVSGVADQATRYVKGTYHSVRIYNATLTEDDLRWNRSVDEARFRGGLATDDVDIVIATNKEGAEGVEPCGEYMVNGSHEFSAVKRVVNGRTVNPAGYTLEKWDAGAGEWKFHAEGDAASFNYVRSPANGRMRLTWKWKDTPLVIILR